MPVEHHPENPQVGEAQPVAAAARVVAGDLAGAESEHQAVDQPEPLRAQDRRDVALREQFLQAVEVAEAGITVNAVCPGYVLTPLVERQIPDTAKARGISEEAVVRDVLLAAQPTKRFVTVEQVAAFTAFLCSDDGASITGAVLPIEGGWTAH